MAQLSLVHLHNIRPHLFEQRQPRLSQRDLHHPSILRPTIAGNPALFLQSVEHARRIRTARNQPLAKLQRLHRCGIFHSKQPQRVVLLSRQPIPAKQFLFEGLQTVERPPQVQKHPLLRRVKRRDVGSRLRGRGWHAKMVHVDTILVQTTIGQTSKQEISESPNAMPRVERSSAQ